MNYWVQTLGDASWRTPRIGDSAKYRAFNHVLQLTLMITWNLILMLWIILNKELEPVTKSNGAKPIPNLGRLEFIVRMKLNENFVIEILMGDTYEFEKLFYWKNDTLFSMNMFKIKFHLSRKGGIAPWLPSSSIPILENFRIFFSQSLFQLLQYCFTNCNKLFRNFNTFLQTL